VLSEAHGVRLYALDGAAGSVRLDAGRLLAIREATASLYAEAEAPEPTTLVWSRSYFGTWREAVDGAPAEVVLADGHLVGVQVPAGRHTIEVWWPRAALIGGSALFAAGAAAGLVLRLRA
jgi:hypothetical protein